nr:hypothetical protein [uncultured Campylobacter sp.]
MHGVKFSKKNFSETRVVKQDAAEALENVCWHLDINALKYGVKDVEAMLALFCKEGFVNETIKSQMTLFTFQIFKINGKFKLCESGANSLQSAS